MLFDIRRESHTACRSVGHLGRRDRNTVGVLTRNAIMETDLVFQKCQKDALSVKHAR